VQATVRRPTARTVQHGWLQVTGWLLSLHVRLHFRNSRGGPGSRTMSGDGQNLLARFENCDARHRLLAPSSNTSRTPAIWGSCLDRRRRSGPDRPPASFGGEPASLFAATGRSGPDRPAAGARRGRHDGGAGRGATAPGLAPDRRQRAPKTDPQGRPPRYPGRLPGNRPSAGHDAAIPAMSMPWRDGSLAAQCRQRALGSALRPAVGDVCFRSSTDFGG